MINRETGSTGRRILSVHGRRTREREELRRVEVSERQTLESQIAPRTGHHAGHTAPYPHRAGERGDHCGRGREAGQERGQGTDTGTRGREKGRGRVGRGAGARPSPQRSGEPRAGPALTRTPLTTVIFSFSSASKVTRRVLPLPPISARGQRGRPQGDSASALPARPAATPLPIGPPRAPARRTPLPIG